MGLSMGYGIPEYHDLQQDYQLDSIDPGFWKMHNTHFSVG
jgi:hypothetical protein